MSHVKELKQHSRQKAQAGMSDNGASAGPRPRLKSVKVKGFRSIEEMDLEYAAAQRLYRRQRRRKEQPHRVLQG